MSLKFVAVMYLATLQAGIISAAAQTATTDAVLSAQLRKSDEVLLKGLHTADRAAWQNLAAPDFFYLGEDGAVTYLNEFLKQMQPMSSPPLDIQTYKLTRAGDTAIVLHEDTDRQNVRYICTETWQYLDGKWRLRALHITNVLSDPPAISLSTVQIDELAGTYQRDSIKYVIRREGDRILAKRADGPDVEEKAETRDVLFTPGGDSRKQMVFLRDEAGRVTGFVVRYETSDILWARVK